MANVQSRVEFESGDLATAANQNAYRAERRDDLDTKDPALDDAGHSKLDTRAQAHARAHLSTFRKRVDERIATVAVLGMGSIGVPLATNLARVGLKTTGIDTDARRVENINMGRQVLRDHPADESREMVRAGHLRATTEYSAMTAADAFIVCVPTPIDERMQPSTRALEAACEQISAHLRPGHLVVLESSCAPGTTKQLVEGTLERSGLRCGVDFFVAFSPDRANSGDSESSPASTPKVVGGIGRKACDMASHLYDTVVERTVEVSNTETAEAVKLMESIFRSVNVALVNELKAVFDAMGVDIWEVLEAAETKPFGFMRFNPGPGVGGPGVPVDPQYLLNKATEQRLASPLVGLAHEINRNMPAKIVDRLQRALEANERCLRGSRILVVGVSYKKDVGEVANSPAIEIINALHARGAKIRYHDPHVPFLTTIKDRETKVLRCRSLRPELIAHHDASLILTDHSNVDYEMIRGISRLVVDTRGVYRDRAKNVVSA